MRTFPQSWYDQVRPTPREMVQVSIVKVLGIVFFVFIVVKVCFTRNYMKILGTNTQSGYLCVNLFWKNKE